MTRLVFDGQPEWGYWDHTWYEDQVLKKCDGRPPSKYVPARCGLREVHPLHEFVGTATIPVKRGEVVLVDLDDGSAKATAMRGFLDRGVCHKIEAPTTG